MSMSSSTFQRTGIIGLLLVLAFVVNAQPAPLSLTTTIHPPYTASYVAYFENTDQLSVRVTNSSNQDRNFYLAGTITTVDGSISVGIESGQSWIGGGLFSPANSSLEFIGAQLAPFLSNASGQLQYQGITEEDIRLGLLPEGEYEVCLQAFDNSTHEALSLSAPSGCSRPFTITYPPPPQLLSPPCGQTVNGTIPQNLLFSWMLPSGPPIGALVEYRFKLVMLPEDPSVIDPLSALQTSNDPVWEGASPTPTLLYGPGMPNLVPGRSYAWYVQAVDLTEQHPFQQEGFSEPCTFKWSILSGTTFNLAYPYMMDTIPWDLVPVMVRFEPHAHPAETGRFHSTLTLYKDGTQHSITERMPGDADILWNSGPYESQQHLLTLGLGQAPYFTEEQAHHINMYRNDALGEGRFKRGGTYSAVAQVRIDTYEQTDPIEGQVQGTFVRGMGRPRPMEPENNAQLPRNSEEGTSGYSPIELSFKTSDTPFGVLPPFPIYIIPETGPPTQTQATVHERWVLQVARDVAFNDIVHSANAELGAGLQLTNPGCGTGCVEAALYKEETVTFTPNADGTYFWRVRWMMDPSTTTGATYHDGPIWRFTVGEAGEDTPPTTPAEEEPIPEAQCLANCRRAPTPVMEQLAADSAQVGDTVQVGLFRMRLTNINYGAGHRASGEGLINVPVMDAALRVRFNDVRINGNRRLFDGTVHALYDNEGVIPPAWITGTSLAAGFSPQAAQVLDEYLNASGRLISQFYGLSPMGLPLGVDKELPGIGRVVIGILGMQFTDTIAHMNAGMALPVQELGTTLSLGNMAMPFHPGGFGDLSEEATLYLLSDVDISIGEDTLKIKGARFADGFTTLQDSGTFVAWDCNGFRAVTFDAEYRFSQENVREDLANGEDGPRKVIGALRTRTGRGGLMGRLDFNTAFHLTDAKNWGFDVDEAWLDLASYANPPDMTLPDRHFLASEHFMEDGTIDPTWTGVYVKRTMLRLPPVIQRFDDSGRTTAQVDDFIYEFGLGVSASVKAANILGTDEAWLNGWAFSVDTLQFDIVLNHFNQGGFKGRMRLPMTDTLLLYTGMIQHDPTTHDTRFEFLLHPDGTLDVPMFVGTMELFETSTVRATLSDPEKGNWARAELNGELNVDITTPFNINFRDIAFEDLYFQTDSPYTNIGDRTVYSLASPQKYMGGSTMDDDDDDEENKAGGFPVSITRVTTERRNSEGGMMAGIGFDINLDLSGQTNIFVATTRIAVLGKLNTSEIHKWGHHDIELDSIGVTGETGAVKIQGGLRWYHNDPTYGNGINGQVNAWFCDDLVHVRAAAQFGTVSGMRYWYADAMATWAGGAGAAGPFTVYGFGGGAWYHMKRMTPLPTAAALTNAMISEQDDEYYQPGITLSSIRFEPDANEYLGLQATVVFGDGAGGRTYNGDLTLGASFTASGGTSTIFLNGNVFMMSERNDRRYVPIRGTAEIAYDKPNKVFQANFQVFVEIGSGIVTGTGDNNLAGAAEILITPDTWHFFVGTPQTPIGLDFRGLFETRSYFMVGKELPDPLPPDSSAVLALMGGGDFSWPSGVATANGVAFGSRTDLDAKFDFYLLRMHLMAGLGFDMVFESAENMTCADVADPGIAGFYATGQVYAYMSGSVSLHVDVWFAEGDFEIMKLAAAAALQGGFADPSWVRGEVGGRYSILGGLIDGSFNFPFEAGHPCDPFGADALAGLEPIDDIIPHDQDGIASTSTAVSVGVNPEVLFTMKLDHPFDLKEYTQSGATRWRKFRLKLDAVELKKNGVLQGASLELSTAGDQVMMIPNQFLEPRTKYTLTVKLRAEEWNEARTELVQSFPVQYADIPAHWATAMIAGEPALWDSTVTFKTGEGLKELSAENLNYSYPFAGQRYLLQDECRNGIIECQKSAEDQPLFDESGVQPRRERVYRVLFTPHSGGTTITAKATVQHTAGTGSEGVENLESGGNNGPKTIITFTIPPLQNNRQYVVQLIARDTLVGGTTAQNLLDGIQPDLAGMGIATTSSQSYQSGMVNLRRRRLAGYTVRHNEKLLYTYHFATSRYNTIGSKAAAYSNSATHYGSNGATPPKETLRPDFLGERFDVFDVKGFQFPGRTCSNCSVSPMITLTDDFSDTWARNWATKVLYDYYAEIKRRNCSGLDLHRTMVTNRFGVPVISDSPDRIGIPPVRTVSWRPGNPTMQPLSAAETAPPSVNGPMNTAQLNITEIGDGSAQSDVCLDQITSHWVGGDHVRLQTITADVLGYCGVLYGETPMAEPLRSMVIAYQSSGYKRPYRGNYRVRFSFNPPPTCPFFSDGPSDIPAMSSGVAVFNYSNGPLPPMPNTSIGNPAAPGNSGTQTAP